VTRDELRSARDTALAAARAGGEVLLASFGRLPSSAVRHKGEKDLVTDVDERSQEVIVAVLSRAFPDHGIFAEESAAPRGGAISGDGARSGDDARSGDGATPGGGSRLRADAPLQWVIDPLDGTTNFVHGYPMVSVSIALEERGTPLVGVVHAPVLGETFEAVAGGGVRRNGEPIRVSARGRMIDALLGTGFACVRDGADNNNLPLLAAVLPRVQGVRRGGSAGLDLAYVAMGRFDGFWELHLSPWDTAAGVLLVREAGGRVTDFDGGADFVANREIVATNGALHVPLLEAIGRGRGTRAP